jgi:predicted unusual protein kinase regulating ubiquinone biosynthesis (AarF/ABC1/UbiB family)
MLPDDRIGLIDYGATKHLTYNERLSACVLYAALFHKDEDMIKAMCEVSGYKSKYGKKEVIMKLTQFGYNSWGSEVTGGKNLVQFTDELKELDPWHEVCAQPRTRCASLRLPHRVSPRSPWH